ncbi:MAG: hypothetical protein CMK74_14800 [Pseudomonadales bacterium]|nr:hypothetical protein [Pseudomonadales bacterium]|tara:strand:+ start:1247 stop:1675 length:429 start_codon:yes stop_codon:yes gene_type:complete
MYDETEKTCVCSTVKRYAEPWQQHDTAELTKVLLKKYRPLYRRQGNFTACLLVARSKKAVKMFIDPANYSSWFMGLTKRHPTLDKNNPLMGRMESLSRAVRAFLRHNDRTEYVVIKDAAELLLVAQAEAEGRYPTTEEFDAF